MKPAVKMLHQKFRCKQRIIRPQETEKLPPLLFPALVVEIFLIFKIRTVRRFIATELELIDSPIMLCEPCPTTTWTLLSFITRFFYYYDESKRPKDSENVNFSRLQLKSEQVQTLQDTKKENNVNCGNTNETTTDTVMSHLHFISFLQNTVP